MRKEEEEGYFQSRFGPSADRWSQKFRFGGRKKSCRSVDVGLD